MAHKGTDCLWEILLIMVTKGVGMVGLTDCLGPEWGVVDHCIRSCQPWRHSVWFHESVVGRVVLPSWTWDRNTTEAKMFSLLCPNLCSHGQQIKGFIFFHIFFIVQAQLSPFEALFLRHHGADQNQMS